MIEAYARNNIILATISFIFVLPVHLKATVAMRVSGSTRSQQRPNLNGVVYEILALLPAFRCDRTPKASAFYDTDQRPDDCAFG
jgi:hypothetical protein